MCRSARCRGVLRPRRPCQVGPAAAALIGDADLEAGGPFKHRNPNVLRGRQVDPLAEAEIYVVTTDERDGAECGQIKGRTCASMCL